MVQRLRRSSVDLRRPRSAPPDQPRRPQLGSGDGCSATCQFEACASAKLTPTAATASSIESASFPASEAINGIIQTGCNTDDRWSSAFSDPQWLNIDLGSVSHINRVVLSWEC